MMQPTEPKLAVFIVLNLALEIARGHPYSKSPGPSRLISEDKPWSYDTVPAEDQICIICLDKERNDNALYIPWTEEEWSVMSRDGVELFFPDCHGCNLCSDCLTKICAANQPCPVCKRQMPAIHLPSNKQQNSTSTTAANRGDRRNSSRINSRRRPRSKSSVLWRLQNYINPSRERTSRALPRQASRHRVRLFLSCFLCGEISADQ